MDGPQTKGRRSVPEQGAEFTSDLFVSAYDRDTSISIGSQGDALEGIAGYTVYFTT